MRRFALAVALTLLATVAVAATPSIDQILSLRAVSHPRISPDGKQVVYLQSQTERPSGDHARNPRR